MISVRKFYRIKQTSWPFKWSFFCFSPQKYGAYSFGQFELNTVQLSQRYSTDCTGYYTAAGSISFSWSAVWLNIFKRKRCLCGKDPAGNHFSRNPLLNLWKVCPVDGSKEFGFFSWKWLFFYKGFNHICSLWEFDAKNFWFLTIKIHWKNRLNFWLKMLWALRAFLFANVVFRELTRLKLCD